MSDTPKNFELIATDNADDLSFRQPPTAFAMPDFSQRAGSGSWLAPLALLANHGGPVTLATTTTPTTATTPNVVEPLAGDAPQSSTSDPPHGDG